MVESYFWCLTTVNRPLREQETILECNHGHVNSCHYSYVTKYKSSKQQKCSGRLTLILIEIWINLIHMKRSFNIKILSHCLTKLPLITSFDVKSMLPTSSTEIFSKRCQTVFNKEAETMIIEHCYSPVRRKCLDNLDNVDSDGVGGIFCKVMFETDCRTVYSMAQNKQKSLPQTICKRLPKTLCGGNNCEFVQVLWLIIFK